MPKYATPPKDKRRSDAFDKGVAMALAAPGDWVLVKKYKKNSTASVAAWRLKNSSRGESLETRCTGGELYLRVVAG